MSDGRARVGSGAPLGSRAPAFFIVGVGASAGGLDALQQLFARLPRQCGMSFVVIQHLDPGRASLLTDVLQAGMDRPVVEATSGMHLEVDRVHVIPAGSDLTVREGILT